MGFWSGLDELVTFMREYRANANERLAKGLFAVASEMESVAKRDAPWTDRTGNARRTLAGVCMSDGDDIYVGLAGYMSYSPKLELGYGGRYAILQPVVESYAPDIIETVKSAVAAQGGEDQ